MVMSRYGRLVQVPHIKLVALTNVPNSVLTTNVPVSQMPRTPPGRKEVNGYTGENIPHIPLS